MEAMTLPAQLVCASGCKRSASDRTEETVQEGPCYCTVAVGTPAASPAIVTHKPSPRRGGRRGAAAELRAAKSAAAAAAAPEVCSAPTPGVMNEGDELAVEAATQNPECGRCCAVLRIAAGIASRRCSAGLFAPLAPESTELRPLLGYVLAYSLGNVVRANELLKVPHVPSVYDCAGCRTPALSLTHYVERFVNFTAAPREVFVTAIAYIDRFLATNPGGVELALCNVHRLFAVAFVVASKFASDLYNSNKYYARVAGVSLEELNVLERSFLADLGYTLNVTPEQYAAYNSPAEFLAHIADVFGDLIPFLCSLVRTLRYRWLTKQSWTPPLPATETTDETILRVETATPSVSPTNAN